MIEHHERFRNLASGFQSIVVAVAVAVGGFWAVFIFDALREADRARLEYERLSQEVRPLRVINVSIEASQLRVNGDPSRYVMVIVQLRNDGRTTERIDWPERPVAITQLKQHPTSGFEFGPVRGTRINSALMGEAGLSETGLRLMPGVALHRAFVAEVAEPGLYFVEFSVDASPEERAVAAAEGVEGGERVSWYEVSYLVVE